MSLDILKGTHVNAHLWAPIHEVESVALDQIRNICALPWTYDHVAVMGDVHYGAGATVGSVIAMKGAVAPSAVGVDIGCGMAAFMTNLTADDLPDDLSDLRSAVEAAIPVGFHSHSEAAKVVWAWKGWASFSYLHPDVQDRQDKARLQVGTLGGGNHFIELCLDTENNVWMILHSGSRNIGKELAERHIKIAKTLEHNDGIPDKDLAVFLTGTPEFQAYRHDLMWAQDYAAQNRKTMLDLYEAVMAKFFPQLSIHMRINCHHNYVAEENHYGADVLVTRKGAISAKPGELGIIPGSMGTKSYIVAGLGNPEAFNSASHGAGRRMSRGKAKKAFTLADLEAQTEGVNCRKDAGVLDEIPGAYKDIDEVMRNQADLVSIVATLKQVMCVKG